MRRPALGTVASYGTVLATTAAEGTLQFMVPPYVQELGYPLAAAGLLYGLPLGVALLCRMPAGLAYRPARARALVATAALIIALTAALLPLAPNQATFAAIQAVHGAGLALATTVTLAHFLGTHGSGAGRVRAMGYYATALSGGFMVGNAASGLFAVQWGYGGALVSASGWALVAAALAWALPPLSAQASPPPTAVGSHWASARRALGDPGLVYTAIVAFLLNLLFHVPGGFFPLYALGVGLGVAEVGFIRTAFAFTNTAVRGLCSDLLQRVGRRRAQGVGIVLQAVGLAAVPLFSSFWPLLGFLVFVAFWRAIVLVANTVSLAEDVDPRRVSRGVSSGVYNAASDLGGIVAPALGGLVGQFFGVDSVFRVLPCLAALLYFGATATVGRAVRPVAPASTPASASRP